MKGKHFKVLGLLGFVTLTTLHVDGAEFIFINLDDPGEGLNDPTPATPVGGNPGTTVGEQRIAALERVGEIWGRFLVSPVPIRVQVNFNPLGANVLASAGPLNADLNFPNAPRQGVFYPIALANSLAGVDRRRTQDDIRVTASSEANFYLGFNQDATQRGSNFIDVMLHELGHGLGFTTFTDTSNGNFSSGIPDTYASLIYDIGNDARWTELTPAQRAASTTSGTNLAWDGPATNAAANQVLALTTGANRLTLDIVLPPDLERTEDVAYSTASFSVRLPATGFSGSIVTANDGSGNGTSTLACQPLVNGDEILGNIAFVRRGQCNFDEKVFHAQEAGAVAVIIANNSNGMISPSADGLVDGEVVELAIPVLTVSQAIGNAIEAASPGARLDLRQRQGARQGVTSGRMNLFAPNPFQSGSSVSHWTTAASPNLLMEPIINPNLDRRLDLTLTQMKDIGWVVVDIPFPIETYDTWAASVFDASETAILEEDDPDEDGATNIEEYFFGSLPDDGNSRRFPEILLEGGETKIEMVVSTLPADLIYTIELSDSLEEFEAAVTNVDLREVSSEAIDDETQRLVFDLVEVQEKRFVRLRIERKLN